MPTSAVRSGTIIGSGQADASKRGSSASPSATASGIPCTLPLGEVVGVLMSEWASSQSTPPGAPWNRARPPSVPIAIEWSPPSTSGISPSPSVAATWSASSSQVRLIALQYRADGSPWSTASDITVRTLPWSWIDSPSSSIRSPSCA